MSVQLQTTAIVRTRGQLTIPETIRTKKSWVSAGSVVSVSTTRADEIVIRPYSADKKHVDWDKLWRDIERVRSYKGKGGGNLSSFIAKDRETRR